MDEPSRKMRVGWIGLGVMGFAMASNLQAAGYELTVFNRTKSKADPLIEKGANWADSPREVALDSDVVFSIVGYPQDVDTVMAGEHGALKGLRKGGIICDMTTSSPELARKIAQQAQSVGCFSLDAPVTGGDVGARQGTLSIFVGGDQTAMQRIQPLLDVLGKKFMYCGPAGMGQQAKLANQAAIAGVMFSVCEAMLFAYKAGVNVPEWLELVIPGAAGSVAMNTLGHRLLQKDFEPGFFIEHFVKDLGLCLDECRRMNLVLPCVNLADQFYRMMEAQGHGKKGTQLLMDCLASLSATDIDFGRSTGSE